MAQSPAKPSPKWECNRHSFQRVRRQPKETGCNVRLVLGRRNSQSPPRSSRRMASREGWSEPGWQTV
eukprot:scaffold40342_cov40-Cyclotella_meneghiniana.AAC.2